MPNGLSKIPITYKATDVQRADLSMHLDILEGLDEIAETVGGDQPYVGKDGQAEGVRRHSVRRIILAGWIRGATNSAYRTLVKELHTLFDPKTPGNLVATLEDATTGTIRARAIAIVWVDPERFGNTRRVRILMDSSAPDWTYS